MVQNFSVNKPLSLEDFPAGHIFSAGLGTTTVLPDIDFETYSEAGCIWNGEKWQAPPSSSKKGIFAVEAARYAEHPTTEVLSLAYDLKDGHGRRRWKPGDPEPADLFDHVRCGGILEAWNAAFERFIWERVCVLRMGWPPVPPRQWRCAMAKSRAHALPGSLDKAAEVLGAPVKTSGKRLINLFSVPRNPTKKDARLRIRPEDAPIEAAEFYQYNEGDIIAEAALSARIPDLQPEEQEWWHVDQAINNRGVQIDMESVRAASIIVREALQRGNAELADITGGVVRSASEIQRLTGWLAGVGVPMASLDEESVSEALKRDDEPCGAYMPPSARRALEIRSAIGSASVKKLFAINNKVCEDGRLRGLYLFHGARTGRVTGAGVQPTNLPSGAADVNLCPRCDQHFGLSKTACPWCWGIGPFIRKAWNPRAVEDALFVISNASLDILEQYFDGALQTIAGCLRGLFIAAPGYDLVSSDFMAIEAVVLAELAGEEWRREVFRTHGMIYEMSAAKAFGVPFEDILRYRQEHGSHHPIRKKGKILELALGYGGWTGALKAFGADEFMTEEEMVSAASAWRQASPNVVKLWGWQTKPGRSRRDYHLHFTSQDIHELSGVEGCAISAVQNPGTSYGTASVTYVTRGDALYCVLPSGRPLTYHRPRLRPSERRMGELTLSFEGWNSNPKYGPVGWVRLDTYGPKLVENIDQAIARDIQRHALLAQERAGYPIVMHTYDENVAEVPEGWGSIADFERIMSDMPWWARNCPVRAAGGWRGKRYRKD